MKKFFRSALLLFALIFFNAGQLSSQSYYPECSQWVKTAEKLKPALKESIIRPVAMVKMVENSQAFQGWESGQIAGMDSVYGHSFKELKQVIVDLGDHYTGYFSFDLETLWGTSDAPLRFRITVGEVPSEMALPFDPYPGTLSRAWLQDEVLTVMSVPARVKLDRRVSGRYVKIELLGSSQYFDFRISNMEFMSVTSAIHEPAALGENTPQMIRQIDRIGLKTLKECMQTVYEDGPKRDRRLWVGDMYLESLANTYSFENHDLTKRCLYLFGGLADEEGYVLGTVFEDPEPHAQEGQRLMDYSLLFNVSLKEYLVASKDTATAQALWPVAKRQLSLFDEYVKDGLVDYERASGEWWIFTDWKDGLDKQASIQGLMMFAMEQSFELAKMLQREDEVPDLPQMIRKMRKAALKNLYNRKTGLVESGTEKQLSVASQVWMILGGVLDRDQGRKALTVIMDQEEALQPGGPYMYHYYIEALIKSGMDAEARKALLAYWGGMVDKGADTFWEVYDPDNDFISPYNAFIVNSYCHAWSCTPVYFVRKYPEIFQE